MGTKPTYYFLNETLVDEDTALKNREVLHENIINSPTGEKLMTITFKQVLQSFNCRNWNGRVYTNKIVMDSIARNPLIQHDLKMGTWTGEYGHPIIEKGMNELARQMTIFPPNACWTIDKIWEENNLLMGECTTLADGYGDMVRDRVLTNYPAMASSRAIGGVDKNGNVLPGYTMITYDCVIRPSHKEAYKVPGSEIMNDFPLNTAQRNTMTESVTKIDYTTDPAFKDFLLSESASRNQIEMLCGAFNLNYDTMQITKNAVIIESTIDYEHHKVVIPLREMIGAEYYNLFM